MASKEIKEMAAAKVHKRPEVAALDKVVSALGITLPTVIQNELDLSVQFEVIDLEAVQVREALIQSSPKKRRKLQSAYFEEVRKCVANSGTLAQFAKVAPLKNPQQQIDDEIEQARAVSEASSNGAAIQRKVLARMIQSDPELFETAKAAFEGLFSYQPGPDAQWADVQANSLQRQVAVAAVLPWLGTLIRVAGIEGSYTTKEAGIAVAKASELLDLNNPEHIKTLPDPAELLNDVKAVTRRVEHAKAVEGLRQQLKTVQAEIDAGPRYLAEEQARAWRSITLPELQVTANKLKDKIAKAKELVAA
jgi:hypothetical protein